MTRGPKPKDNRRRPRFLVTILFVCAAAWGVQSLTSSPYEPPPLLGAESFSHVAAVQAVTAKPPSLYIRLETGSWVRMSPQQRRRTLEEIGTIAAEAGYVGAHARTGDGVAVGQWLEIRGVRLFSPTDGGT